MSDQAKPNFPRQQRVTREQFLRMLTSRKQYVRVDHPKLGIRGLLDDTGCLFVIDKNELLAPTR